jgi:nicotinamidase/pyrazinamidase
METAEIAEHFGEHDALIVVDVQVDFCPGGKLAVEEGDEIIPELNRWILAAHNAGLPVYASRDWHPHNHMSFEEQGGDWPPHCIQDSLGASYHPDLRLPEDVVRVSKGTRFDRDQYSVFDRTGLGDHLRELGVERVWIGGLAEDVCVRASVLAACEEGFETHLLVDATRPVDPEAHEEVVEEMREAGAKLVGEHRGGQ